MTNYSKFDQIIDDLDLRWLFTKLLDFQYTFKIYAIKNQNQKYNFKTGKIFKNMQYFSVFDL